MVPPLKSLSARQFNYKSVYQKTSQSLYRYRASRMGKGKTNQERLNPKAETKYNENNNKKGLPRFSLLLKFVCCRNLVGYQKHIFTAETVSAETTGPTTTSTTKKEKREESRIPHGKIFVDGHSTSLLQPEMDVTLFIQFSNVTF